MFPKPLKQEKKRKYHKKTERQKKIDKADALFSLLIRKVGYCQLAGKDKIRCGGNLQCMHKYTRGAWSIRWDPANALCGCAGHHVYYTNHPEEWREFLEAHYSEEWAYVQQARHVMWDKDIDKVLVGLEGLE